MIYILTHEYSDKSGFKVCGVTDNSSVAKAWVEAGYAAATNELHAYIASDLDHVDSEGLMEAYPTGGKSNA